MAVDIDDQRVLQVPLITLTGSIDKELRRVELLNRHLVQMICRDFHPLNLSLCPVFMQAAGS